MARRAILTALAALALVPAAPAALVAQPAQPYAPDIAYGPIRMMKGIYTTGFEVSSFELCETTRDACLAGGEGASEPCWTEFSPAASRKLEALARQRVMTKYQSSRHWIEFRGRKTRGEQRYGHLGGYRCKVMVEVITGYSRL